MTATPDARTDQTPEDPPGRLLDVAVLDDCPLVVHGVTSILAPYVRRVRAVVDPPTSGWMADADVTLWDPAPGGEGRGRRLPALLAQHRHGRLLMHSFHASTELVADMLAGGCVGYVDKGATGADLVHTVLRAGTVAQARSARPDPDQPGTLPALAVGQRELSPRERQLLALIARGLTNECIAGSRTCPTTP